MCRLPDAMDSVDERVKMFFRKCQTGQNLKQEFKDEQFKKLKEVIQFNESKINSGGSRIPRTGLHQASATVAARSLQINCNISGMFIYTKREW